MAVLLCERIQSLHVRQGPLTHRQDLTSLRLDVVAQEAPASITSLDAAGAKVLAIWIDQQVLYRVRIEQLDRQLAHAVATTQPAKHSVC